jgi:glutamate decarboxylase
MVAQNRSKHIGIHSGLSNKLSTINLPMEILRHELADHGIDAELAYDIIHEHLMLDGNSRLNLATFVSTWMEPQARRLMDECADKNMIDKDEYPQTAEIEERCLKILANLWHAPDPDAALGTSTTGSSEACMLAGLVMRWHWRQKRSSQGKDTNRPNLVMGSNSQICWEKFCVYFDVERRLVPIKPHRLQLSGDS